MLTKVSSKGQTVIPSAIRELAGIRTGDELDVGCSGGMIVMRKRVPLTAARVRALLRQGQGLPGISPADEQGVARAMDRVRRRGA